MDPLGAGQYVPYCSVAGEIGTENLSRSESRNRSNRSYRQASNSTGKAVEEPYWPSASGGPIGLVESARSESAAPYQLTIYYLRRADPVLAHSPSAKKRSSLHHKSQPTHGETMRPLVF